MVSPSLRLCACALALGCSGSIMPEGASGPAGDSTSGDTSGRTGGAGAPGSKGMPSGPSSVGDSKAFKPAPTGLRRLTSTQYAGSLRDLLGATITVPGDLEPDRKDFQFSTIGAFGVTTSGNGVEKFRLAAFDVAHQVFGAADRAKALVGCAPASASDPCVDAFLRSFGRRAFRRPLTPDELTDYKKIVSVTAAESGSAMTGVEFAVAGLLQSPAFLYVAELGEPDPDDRTRLRYTGYEMATRLSLALWGTAPDQQLLDDADKGLLVTAAGLRAAVDRLLASPRVRDVLVDFFGESYGYEDLPGKAKDKTTFPKFDPALLGAMKEELDRTLTDLALRQDASFMDALDTRQTFVNKALASFYGVTPPTGTDYTKVEQPAAGPRAGLMTTGGVLSMYAYAGRSSPTLRGVFVRQRLQCLPVPSPPDDVDTSLDKPQQAGSKTMRERLSRHATDPQCAACHSFFDPVGLSLENFDGVGLFRTVENGVTLDVSGDIDGNHYTGARELAALLKADARTGACVARELYRYAVGHVDTDGEGAVVEQLATRFATGSYKVRTLLADLTTSAGFRYASGGAR